MAWNSLLCVRHSDKGHLLRWSLHNCKTLGIAGYKNVPLNFTIERNIPRKALWGEDLGRVLMDEETPSEVRIMSS